MKRSGFTMIELIFVIVILGILASVAIPKLAATRDDAKVSKALNELATLKSDLSAYYTAHGTYKTGTGTTKIQDATNVTVYTNKACTSKATGINSGTKYYYCVPKTGTGNEPLVEIIPNDTKGMLTINKQTMSGNIGNQIAGLDSFKTLAVTVQNGGSRVSF